MTQPDKLLFQTIQIGPLSLSNRIIMGSMHTGLDHSNAPFNRLAAFYQERAQGGVALMVTGGVSPNETGRLSPGAMILDNPKQIASYKKITQAVHAANSKIILQILHAGRYAKQPNLVAPSAIRSPINKFSPTEMTQDEILQTIDDYVRCATLAQQAGFDGIEILGSEGYLLNEFTAPRTNQRSDKWGGSFENRIRFPLEIIQAIRQKMGNSFFIQFRMSVLDLVDNGWTIHEAIKFAQALESSGINLINTGIGWHEASIPTISMSVPRGAFSWATAKIKQAVNIPVAAANRINTVDVAEGILQRGEADMLYMSRPFLADPDFVNKAQQAQVEDINVCIACNQSCLDNLFSHKTVSCLVNPRACHETFYPKQQQTQKIQKIAVIGAGPAGLSFSIKAAEQGHKVTLFEASSTIGGQLLLARKVPDKEEFDELLRYFQVMLKKHSVNLQLNCRVDTKHLANEDYDAIVLASGVKPKTIELQGVQHNKVLNYEQAFNKPERIGRQVIILGAGGIGFDMAEFLTHPQNIYNPVESFNLNWGIDSDEHQSGALSPQLTKTHQVPRKVTLLQRKEGRFGRTLGKTTGWIQQLELQKRGIKMLAGVTYIKIDDEGLHIEQDGKHQVLAAEHIILCTGQRSEDALVTSLKGLTAKFYQIGGVNKAAGLDAAQAIREGTDLAYSLVQ